VTTLGRIEYGLFLFHQQKEHFTAMHLLQARASAKLIGSIIAREEAEALVQRVQPVVFAGQIGSALIHEMNNRMGSIVNYTKFLKVEHEAIENDLSKAVDPVLRKKIRGYVDKLESNNKAVEKLISTFLGLMNKERRELVNINDLLRRARTVLAPIAETERVDIFLKLDEELPSTLAVGVWLEQVFVNIMLNAIQLMRDGGELVIQSRFAGQRGQMPLQVRFTDTGPGIHGQHAAQIFELGFSTRPEGTGLGLFTARRLMGFLRGRISIEKSAMLVGTTFLIEVPLVVPSV
jgi:signal transduction histidine kinase